MHSGKKLLKLGNDRGAERARKVLRGGITRGIPTAALFALVLLPLAGARAAAVAAAAAGRRYRRAALPLVLAAAAAVAAAAAPAAATGAELLCERKEVKL